MSWSMSFPKPVLKSEADQAIDKLGLSEDCPKLCEEMADQLRTAKQAAKVLLTNVPGPYVSISMSGHANAVGWQKKSGMANDGIYVNVQQICEEDLKYYS